MLAGIRHFGAHRDAPDSRDRVYHAPANILKALPNTVDLRPQCPPVYDQRPLQSCTANATAAAIEFERMRRGVKPGFTPSRLFIYYNERKLLGTENQDDGAPLREAIKVLAKHGDCPEPHWPYDPAKVNAAPPDACYSQALKYKDLVYERLPQDLPAMRACLALGSPFVLTFAIYSGSDTPAAAKAETFPVPQAGEKLIGNHAVMAVGYDHARERFLMRNSWGPKWGMQGHFWLPYAYASDPKLAGDLWTLRLVP